MTPVHSVSAYFLALYSTLPVSAKPQVSANSPLRPSMPLLPPRCGFPRALAITIPARLLRSRSRPRLYLNSSPRPDNINF
jgi:hypothetical protein